MKKFQFAFATLLKLKSVAEAEAQRELQNIKAKVRSEEDILYRMYESVENSYQLGLEYKLEGKEVSPRLDVVDTFIKGQNIRIEQKREEIRRLKQLEEEKQEIWLEKRKEKKSLELLKERKMDEHKKEVMQKQAKNLDDIISTRFAARVGEENG